MLASLASLLPVAVVAGTIQFSGEVSLTRYTTGMAMYADGRCTGEIGESSLPYEAHSFTVDTAGVYAIHEHLDPYYLGVYVYAGGFDPRAPAANCIAASFAQPVRLWIPLEAGVTHTIVVVYWGWDYGESYRVSVNGPGAIAGPCAGFTDVWYADPFCRSIEWARNRGVTHGCTATSFCPVATATRLQIVAMLSRLARSLEPEFLVGSAANPTAAATGGNIVCETPVYSVVGYPRIATVTAAMVRHRASTAVEVRTQLAMSIDNRHWQDAGELAAAATNLPNAYATQWPAAPPITLDRGRWVTFGIRVTAGVALAETACLLTMRLDAVASDPSPAL
jgi:hypothetical protein